MFAAMYNGGNIYDISGGGIDGAIAAISKLKAAGVTIDSINVWDHGFNGPNGNVGQQFGTDKCGNDINLNSIDSAKMRALGNLMTSDGVINLMGCEVGSNEAGLQKYANNFGRTVTASTADVGYNVLSSYFRMNVPWLTTVRKSPQQ